MSTPLRSLAVDAVFFFVDPLTSQPSEVPAPAA
jgi:hypothetical protein